MPFYNRVGPRTNVDIAGEHPLDVTPIGGKSSVTLALNSSVTQQLAAPASGYAYRLHLAALIGASFAVVEGQLSDANGSFWTFDSNTPFTLLDGLIVTSAISGSLASSTAGGTLRYDLIVYPVVT